MKAYVLDFLKRGLMAAAGGPIILAIIYGCLGLTGEVAALTLQEVSLGIFSVTFIAFVAGGITTIYQIERLPLLHAIVIHAVALYLDYLVMYLVNDWIPRDPKAISLFTVIYVLGYTLVWAVILLTIRSKTAKLNKQLSK